MTSSPSPTSTCVLLKVVVLAVLFKAITVCLDRLASQYPNSLRLLCAQAIALCASYSVRWLVRTVLQNFRDVKAFFEHGEVDYAELIYNCSVSYLAERIPSRLRQILWRIPDFIRLQHRGVDGGVPAFRALLHLAVKEDPSSSFPFDQRLALVLFALEKGHQRMLQILLRSMRPSGNCSSNLRELQQRLSDFDDLPHSVQHLVSEKLASLVELAVEQDHFSIQSFGDLVSTVHLGLQHGRVLSIPVNGQALNMM